MTSLSKATRAKVSMDAALFDEYQCEAERGSNKIQFGLSLTTLLDCLTLCSSPEETSVSIVYERRDAVFRLTLEEAGVQTVCELSVLVSDDLVDVNSGLTSAFLNSEEETNIILKSDALREAVMELTDTAGAVEVRVEVRGASTDKGGSDGTLENSMLGSAHNLSAAQGGVVLSAAGNLGECEMVLSAESDLIFVSFNCSRPRLVWTYPMTSFQLGMKALGVANETYLRINQDGIMALQHQIDSGHGSETYVDFLMVALDKAPEDGGRGRTEEKGTGFSQDSDGGHMGDVHPDDPFNQPFSVSGPNGTGS